MQEKYACPLKICLVSSVFPPKIGGPSTQTYQLAKLLEEDKQDVFVITFGKENKCEILDKTKVYYLRDYEGIKLKNLFKYINAYRKISEILRKEKPTVLHHQTGVDYLCLISSILAKRNKIPSFVKYAGDLVWERVVAKNQLSLKYEDVFSYNLSAKFLRRLEKYILDNFTAVWGISSFQKNSLLNIHSIPNEKIISMPNYIDLDSKKKNVIKKKEYFEILVICRFAPWKKVDDSIKIFSMLKNKNTRLKIVGGGNENLTKHFKELSLKLNLSSRVTFIGSVSPTEVHKIFENADIMLSNTIYEPCAISFIEAMASGLPLVTTRIGGTPDIVIENETGFLFEPLQLNKMAEKIDELVENQELREKIGNQAFLHAKKFDMKSNLQALINVYKNLVLQNDFK